MHTGYTLHVHCVCTVLVRYTACARHVHSTYTAVPAARGSSPYRAACSWAAAATATGRGLGRAAPRASGCPPCRVERHTAAAAAPTPRRRHRHHRCHDRFRRRCLSKRPKHRRRHLRLLVPRYRRPRHRYAGAYPAERFTRHEAWARARFWIWARARAQGRAKWVRPTVVVPTCAAAHAAPSTSLIMPSSPAGRTRAAAGGRGAARPPPPSRPRFSHRATGRAGRGFGACHAAPPVRRHASAAAPGSCVSSRSHRSWHSAPVRPGM